MTNGRSYFWLASSEMLSFLFQCNRTRLNEAAGIFPSRQSARAFGSSAQRVGLLVTEIRPRVL